MPAADKNANAVELTGELIVQIHGCGDHNHKGPHEVYVLDDGKSAAMLELDVGGIDRSMLKSGSRVRVRGAYHANPKSTIGRKLFKLSTPPVEDPVAAPIADDAAGAAEASQTSEPPAVQAAGVTTQTLNTLLIFAHTTDRTITTTQMTETTARLFTNPTGNIRDFFLKATYGHYTMSLGASVVVNLNLASSAPYGDLEAAALAAALSAGYDRNNYDRTMIMVPNDYGYAYAGMPGRVSVYPSDLSGGTLDIYAHELGHNFGFHHSGVGTDQYADQTSAMGGMHWGTESEVYNVAKIQQNNWFAPFPGSYQSVTGDATFNVYPTHVSPADTPGVRAVNINGTDHYFSYLRNSAPYGWLGDAAHRDKVILHQKAGGSSVSWRQAVVGVGATDVTSGIPVRFEAYGPNNEYAIVSFDCDDGNAKPVADNLSVDVMKNVGRAINLPAHDANPDDPLTYSIHEAPSHGTLSGSGASRTYTPTADYVGADSFVYVVNDGKISSFGTITINVFSAMGMTVSSPDGGEQWARGSTHALHWGSSKGGHVSIELYKGGAFHSTIVASTVNDGTYEWSVPELTPGNDYAVKITRTQSPYEADTSDAGFSIVSSLALQSPNGGEKWLRSTVRTLAWSSLMGGNVRIDLYKGGVFHSTISSATPNDGAYAWLIPATQAAGNDYSVKVTSLEMPSETDLGDSSFTIAIPSSTILYENLDTNPGFATTGSFEYGVPSPVCGATTYTHQPPAVSNGTYIYDTDLDDTCWAQSTLRTPALNCKNYTGVSLQFLANQYFPAAWGASWEISTDGITWTSLYSTSANTNLSWRTYNYDISAIADGQEAVYIRWSYFGSGGSWWGAGLAIDDIQVTGTFVPDTAPAGVTVLESGVSTRVTEGGTTDTYTVVLDSQPSSSVTINISTADGETSVSPASLSFTTSNWASPQTVTVAAVNDADHENSHAATIVHTASSSDLKYNGISVRTITAHITDNDNAAPTVVNLGATPNPVGLNDSTPIPWTPADIATTLWLDASDALSVLRAGSAVYQWNDKSPNGNHATQSAAGAQPIYDGANNKLTFDGGDILKVTNDPFNGLQNFAVISLQRWTASSSWNNACASYHGETGNGWQFRQYSSSFDKLTFTRRGSAGTADPVPTATVNDSDHIAVGMRKNSQSVVMRHNGSQVFSATNDTGSIAYTGSNRSAVGGRYAGDAWTTPGGYLKGDLKELIVIANATDDHVERAEGYLAHKWNRPLPAGHSYKDLPPTNGSIPIATVSLSGTAADPDGDALTTLWTLESSQPAGLAVTFGDAAAANTTVTFTAAGTYTFKLTASDGTDQQSGTLTITINPPGTPYISWTASGNFAHSFSDTVIGNNPDGDHRTNLMEFAFGTDPTLTDMGSLAIDGSRHGDPLARKEAGNAYYLYFLRRVDHGTPGGVSYTPRFSTDLSTFESDNTGLEVVGRSSLNANYELIKIPFPTGKRFGRVELQAVP